MLKDICFIELPAEYVQTRRDGLEQAIETILQLLCSCRDIDLFAEEICNTLKFLRGLRCDYEAENCLGIDEVRSIVEKFAQ